jgi:glycosidase
MPKMHATTHAIAPTSPVSASFASEGIPAWLRGGTIYGIITSRVGAGTFRDVADRLDDLADLGIAAIWLAPVTKTLPNHFGYEVTDYLDVRPEYGTIEDLRALVEAAHARGIRVLLDVVPNHTSVRHPWFQAAERDGPASPFHAWYDRDDAGAPTNYFDWTHLPNLNLDHPEVRAAITEAMLFWVRECDIDGFRVDVAWGIRQRRPDFWPTFVQAFRGLKPDGLLVAEASAHDPFYLKNGFDLVYDWTPDLGHWAWDGAFEGGTPIPAAIRTAVEAGVTGAYDPTARTLRFLNNNDTGARFITRHGDDMYRVALALLMTLPGVPCLYLGDDIGAEYEPYGPVEAFPTHADRGLRSYVRALVRLRRELLAGPARSWSWLRTSDNDAVLAFAIDGDAGPVIVLLNFSAKARSVRIVERDLPGSLRDAAIVADRLAETEIAIDDESIPLDAWGVRVLTPAQVLP